MTQPLSDEDWRVFDILCGQKMDSEDTINNHEMISTLKSELAALQFKRDRLMSELQDTKGQLRTRDQRTVELEAETEMLKEQQVRQNSIIASLRNRIKELEDQERMLTTSLGRADMSSESLARENRHQAEKCSELERKINLLELNCTQAENARDSARRSMSEFVSRASIALGYESLNSDSPAAVDVVLSKASEMHQELNRLRRKNISASENLTSIEVELRNCREQLERALADKENLQRQAAGHILEIDKLKQEKEHLEMQQRVMERELSELRDKLMATNRSLGIASNNIASQEATIFTLRNDLRGHDEKCQKMQIDMQHFLESLAVCLTSADGYVQSTESGVKDAVKRLVNELATKSTLHGESKDRIISLTDRIERLQIDQDRLASENRVLTDEKRNLETRLNHAESELNVCEMTKEHLRNDKTIFVTFLDKLSRAMHMDQIAKDVGVDLHTESLLLRAEQLAKLEYDKNIDKLLLGYPYTSSSLSRHRLYCDFPYRESALVYQLQRRVRTLRDQLQRRDLHLDLLRKKISVQDESTKIRSLLETERDEANIRAKKLQKQLDKAQLQLTECRAQIRDLKLQLSDAGDCKLTSLERAKKIDDLEKRLVESEMLRMRFSRKVTVLKEQLKSTSDSHNQDKTLNEHTMRVLQDELSSIKFQLSEVKRRECSLEDLRRTVISLLALDSSCTDYEITSKITKLVAAHREYSILSKRYDDPLPSYVHLPPPSESSDPLTVDDFEILNSAYNKRSQRKT
ncbi:coiled-coil domain-containing protein 170 isoform X1 [Melanaphis sacchari]|uniref:coiled-coil domain-containing protein 170 isoform X1 n=2 Tax=Melanaphis sacchari TaxID=742174 RepID=UPI000DC138E9|nr:coiled-coil domain-containing protein 170 isoform X1 [Melanaphis sacchari]